MAETLSIDDFSSRVGEEFGVSPWFHVTQDRVTAFGGLTLDFDPHHIEPRSAAAGPFGVPTAQGFLTLSLLTHFISGSLPALRHKHHINYGLDRVRFPRPVVVGTRLRARFTLAGAETRGPGATILKFEVTIEGDDGGKPYLQATWLALFLEEESTGPN